MMEKMCVLGIRVPVTLKHSRWNGSDSISYVTVPSGCVLTLGPEDYKIDRSSLVLQPLTGTRD